VEGFFGIIMGILQYRDKACLVSTVYSLLLASAGISKLTVDVSVFASSFEASGVSSAFVSSAFDF